MSSVGVLDRERERAVLDKAWDCAVDGKPQLVLCWGRRRVGKTFLLSHWKAGKRSVFFGATEQAEAIELARLTEAVRRDLGSATADLTGGGFHGWEAALRYFAGLAADEPLVVVLDEVPYLVRSTPGFASIVQVVWDHVSPGTKLMLVLMGSAVGVVKEMIGAGGALRGRPTATLKIDPFDPLAARLFLPRLEPLRFVEAYAACGGYPLHLQSWDPELSTRDNLIELVATPGGLLLEDAAMIMREQLPETGGYSRVLAAIGRGRTRFSEIAGEAEQRVERPLEVLAEAGFVAKASPIGAPRGARPTYEIADVYLAFWFRVLYSDIPEIEAGQGRQVLTRRREQWQRHLRAVFEQLARAHARRLVARGDLPQDLVLGRWWTVTGEPCEVDVVGLQGSRAKLFGETRWQESPLRTRDLDELKDKAKRFTKRGDDLIFALWGRGGVAPEVARQGVWGFGLEDVIEDISALPKDS